MGGYGWKSDAKTFHGPFTGDQLRRGNCHPLEPPHTVPISYLVFRSGPSSFLPPFSRRFVHTILGRLSFHPIERINCELTVLDRRGKSATNVETLKWDGFFSFLRGVLNGSMRMTINVTDVIFH